MLRALIHHRRIHLAVVAGAAVATAVLTGALMVGDSVRGSLRDLTLDRLGHIDLGLIGRGFFRDGLGADLLERPGSADLFESAAPAIVLRGSVVHDDTQARASQVGVQGVDERFLALYEGASFDLSRESGQLFPSVVLNASLQRELDAAVGDSLVIRFPLHAAIPRDTLLGETDTDAVLGAMRVTVKAVIPDDGAGRFALQPNQHRPLNAFVDLEVLQRELDLSGRTNALFVTRAPDAPAGTLERADSMLTRSLQLSDLGLRIWPSRGALAVESDEFVLRPGVVEAIDALAAERGLDVLHVQSYLANRMKVGDRTLPYSLVAAVDRVAPFPSSPDEGLVTIDGEPASLPGGDRILLNTWAADDLGASVGDALTMRYFVVGADEELTEQTHTFTVAGIVKMQGLGANSELTPEYPGMQDSDDMADWDPPFPVDLGRIRDRDEAYWDRHGAVPKAFVGLSTGQSLWSTRYGSLTSLRIGASEDLADRRDAFERAVIDRLAADTFGFRFDPLKRQGLSASSGATDFAGLFVAFSFFIILSAAMLVALLFSLGVERRAREIGLLLAVGFRPRQVRNRFLGEGAVLAAVGGVLGLIGGVGYAWLMMAGLRSLWLPAVGSSELYLHVRSMTLVIGWVASVLVVLVSIALTLRRLRKLPPPRLLAGSVTPPRRARRSVVAPWLAWGGLIGGIGLAVTAFATGQSQNPGLAFGTGALLLTSGLGFFAVWCRRGGGKLRGSLLGMATRNTAWSPGRSILSIALVACASFVIVTVAASRTEFGAEIESRDSGTGGFSVVAESDVPLYQDLSSANGRAELGFDEQDAEVVARNEVVGLRLLPGDDASCLNLYRPERPRVLGAPPALIERGGFAFAATAEGGADAPWTLLDQDLGPDVVPAFADANSAQWILKLGLGDALEMENERGESIRLRLVGLLQTSVFQSELIISEDRFRDHFPSQGGYRYFLAGEAGRDPSELISVLESTLAPFGFDAVTTREKLAGYQVVEHTYLATFQMLGALGLLLGTIGLAVILVRNVIERRGELATLRAFGFRRSRLAWLVLAENSFLLVFGVAVGTAAALAGVAPRLASLHVPWATLAITLGTIVLVGLLSGLAGVSGALRVPLLNELKAER